MDIKLMLAAIVVLTNMTLFVIAVLGWERYHDLAIASLLCGDGFLTTIYLIQFTSTLPADFGASFVEVLVMIFLYGLLGFGLMLTAIGSYQSMKGLIKELSAVFLMEDTQEFLLRMKYILSIELCLATMVIIANTMFH